MICVRSEEETLEYWATWVSCALLNKVRLGVSSREQSGTAIID